MTWVWAGMGWLQLVGSLKLYVCFAESRLFCTALLQKRPIIWRSLLVIATPYVWHDSFNVVQRITEWVMSHIPAQIRAYWNIWTHEWSCHIYLPELMLTEIYICVTNYVSQRINESRVTYICPNSCIFIHMIYVHGELYVTNSWMTHVTHTARNRAYG